MKSHPMYFPPASFSACRLLVALLATAGFFAAASVRANQVYQACGKKWARQAAKLPPAQLEWMMEQRAAEVERDLDGDGVVDHLTMTSTPSFRGCDVQRSWWKKETTIRIEYGDGKAQLFHWIGEHLVAQMRLFPEIGRVLLSGVDANGIEAGRWVDYRHGEGPMPMPLTTIAALEKEGTMQLAGGLR